MTQDKTELVQLQENLFQSRKEDLHENVATVVTQAEVWGTANERDLSQALQYKYEALKDRLLRDALIQQVGVTEWAALGDNDRFIKLAQMKLKVQELQRQGTVPVTPLCFGIRLNSFKLKKLTKRGYPRGNQRSKKPMRLSSCKKNKRYGSSIFS